MLIFSSRIFIFVFVFILYYLFPIHIRKTKHTIIIWNNNLIFFIILLFCLIHSLGIIKDKKTVTPVLLLIKHIFLYLYKYKCNWLIFSCQSLLYFEYAYFLNFNAAVVINACIGTVSITPIVPQSPQTISVIMEL